MREMQCWKLASRIPLLPVRSMTLRLASSLLLGVAVRTVRYVLWHLSVADGDGLVLMGYL